MQENRHTTMTTSKQDTICAIATAQGGAIGIIRVSGTDAIAIADKIFRPKASGKPLSLRKAYTIAFGDIIDEGGATLDEVLVSIFRAPHSYTGEDSVEISCHGSSYILQRAMQLLTAAGCRPAGPGEYTQRAFLNGKMDLSQAEAVADLIASTSAAAHRMALNQMRGQFSRELSALRDRLLHLTSLMELELDFSDHEELEFADRSELAAVAAQIETVISRLANSFQLGNAIKNGVPVAIIGDTNAGKSTLLNQLVGEERAIVSDIHGTTRDVIEDVVNINGTTFRFIDTAGIRHTTDKIESLGIERTFKKAAQAEIVLLIVDATHAQEQLGTLTPQVLPVCGGKTLVVVFNKTDLTEAFAPTLPEALSAGAPSSAEAPEAPKAVHTLCLSAKTGEGIPALKSLLSQAVTSVDADPNAVIVSNIRHYNALSAALDAIRRVQQSLAIGTPTDLISIDLHDCLDQLAEITGGGISTDEVLGNIFKHFCIGK